MENKGYNASSDEDKSSMQLTDQSVTDIKVDVSPDGKLEIDNVDEKRPLATEPYAGMGKEDLLRFSETPFWNRVRLVCLVIFWLAWLALLVTVVVLTIVLPRCQAAPSQLWWQKSVLYQVYVRSFYDSDGDGIGDINGITNKLDYIKDIGVGGLVLSSVYLSSTGTLPDYGYEVQNHTDINPEYGTLEDLDNLIREAHNRDIKVILPFIPNHTGTQHPWWLQSASATPGDKRNYYIWQPCTPPSVLPSNWASVYNGPAWTMETNRSECFLHQLLNTQPELNLRSSLVKQELEAIMRFWLDRGVDGFRVDSATFMFEDLDLRNELHNTTCGPVTDYTCLDHVYTRNQSEIHDLVTRWREVVNEYSTSTGNHRVLLTDAMEDSWGALAYYDRYGRTGAHLALNYQLTSRQMSPECNSQCTAQLTDSWVYYIPQNSTLNWMTGTQDISRLASVMGTKYVNVMHMLTMTMPGVPVIYYGDELGITNGNNDNRDPVSAINTAWSRDPFRQPMHWDNSTYAGFVNSTAGTGTPWLTVINQTNINVRTLNASDAESNSTFKFFRAMSQLHQDPAFLHGNLHYVIVDANTISYIREFDGTTRYLVALNFGNVRNKQNYKDAHYMIPGFAEIVLNTHRYFTSGNEIDLSSVGLEAGEGVICKWVYSR